MSAFEYPPRFFRCRERNAPPAYDHVKIEDRHLARLAEAPGAIRGETGIPGLKLDFCSGLRLQVPEGNWHVAVRDADTEMVLLDMDASEATLVSVEKFYIRWQVEARRDGQLVFSHEFDPRGQEVFIDCDRPMGDALATLPYIREYQRLHGCHVRCKVPGGMEDLVARYYPELELGDAMAEDTYAAYAMFPWMDMEHPPGSLVDAKQVVTANVGQVLLGIPAPVPKPVFAPMGGRRIPEPYVCISVQASAVRKGWLYPGGWEIVVDYLKSLGYRALCIDRAWKQEERGLAMEMPSNAEDATGDIPLLDRLELLAHADFFIGLSSGLSYLAYYAGCPVVMICGFTEDWYEFPTPYRVANRMVCNGCYNDVRVSYHLDFCPYHHGTERELECQKRISPRQVMAAIDRLVQDRQRMKQKSR